MNIYCSYLSNSFGHFQSICNNQKLKQLNWQRKPFTKNSYDHHGHKGGVGNGEGVALGYTLLKTNMPYKVIFGSNP